MEKTLSVAGWLLPLAYLALLIDYGVSFFLRIKAHARNRWLIPALALHAAYLILRSIALRQPPLVSNYEILSVVAFSTACVYAVLESLGRDRRTGMFIFLLVFLFQYTSSIFLTRGVSDATGRTNWTGLHVVPAILAYTAFSVAAVYGLLHLLARRGLKQHRFGILFDRLPSLEWLGRMSWHAVVVGFVLITITIVAAVAFVMLGWLRTAGGTGLSDPKITTKIMVGTAAFVLYLIAVLGKWIGKWPLSRISSIAVNGFLALVALFVVSAILS